jgi:uncharacterized protein involved in exopolysaccharide biosynthesis
MNIIQFLLILKRHIILLLGVPVMLAVIVAYLTRNPTLQYESETVIYTGIASGYNLEQNDRFDLFGSRNAFDNLINVVKSRETYTETALRLYVKCLSLDTYQKHIISKPAFIDLRVKTPQRIKDLLEKPILDDSLVIAETYANNIRRFREYLNADDTNYLYGLLNYNHKFFSIKAISKINVSRVQSSDLIQIKYKSEDPGITVQTLKILTDVFIEHYKSLKENQSDAVVAYFQKEVDKSKVVLNDAENELLEFNKGNSIINYYEQSKFIAVKKEDIDEAIQEEKVKKAGAEQALIRLETQLDNQSRIQGISDDILVKRDRLIEITEKLTINEIYNEPDTSSKNEIERLKLEADLLEYELNQDLNNLYSFTNSTGGLPIAGILEEWMANLIKLAEANAALQVLYNRQEEFKKNYDEYAPLGANISRIERKIDVAEREYLSLLNSLNEAKLKQQNESLSSNLKPLDPPYFPLSAIPSKRKVIIVAAAMFGFILVAASILLTEYLDNTIKNLARGEKVTGLESIGIMPKIIGKYRKYDLAFITNRLIELLIQDIKFYTKTQEDNFNTQYKLIMMFGTSPQEGKSFLTGKLVDKLRAMGDRVLFLNYQFFEDTLAGEEGRKKSGKEGILQKLNPLKFIQRSGKKRGEQILNTNENLDNIKYTIDDTFAEKSDLFDLTLNQDVNSFDNYKYVFMEIPAILYHFFPAAIVEKSDLNLMVARSNREWKKADTTALESYSQYTRKKPMLLLNGTEIEEIEGVIGTLPKHRSKLRRVLKQVIRLQFYTKSSIS